MKTNSRQEKTAEKEIEELELKFDPQVVHYQNGWFDRAQVVCVVNPYPNGITLSIHENNSLDSSANGKDERARNILADMFHLRVRDTRDYQLPDGRYFLYREDFQKSLERQLSHLHKNDILGSTLIIFGVTADPFLAFQKKFDVTTGCLEVFEQYRPGMFVLQTRSPMVITALPTFKCLAQQSAVVMHVETHLEKSVLRYTPGQPRIAERLLAAQGIRRQGVPVTIAVSPLLPYGEYYRDAWEFGEVLGQHADHITFGCLASGRESDEKDLRILPISRKLAADRQFRLLRPFAYRYLHHALRTICPEKLSLPEFKPAKASQLALFAA